jgi:ubiquinone/menaquinone biosynthesis C-methylase UbiE
MIWLVLFVSLAIIVFLLWWLLIRTEGVYLGKRVVIWLYDIYAVRYDSIVQHDDIEEHLYLAIPIMQRISPETQPFVLDVATGTGRMPLALCQHAAFDGQIYAFDLSQEMLKQAVKKIADNHFESFVAFGLANGQKLPFADDIFDIVTCMEALEFMPHPDEGLKELVRVLCPNGLLLITRRLNEPMMPTRLWSQEYMAQALENMGIEQIEFDVWQYDYEKVWGIKSLKQHPIDKS